MQVKQRFPCQDAGIYGVVVATDEAERDLLRELQDAKPEHYKLIVDQYRAALAYRKQLAQRDAERLERQRREAYDDAQLHLVSTAKRPADAVSQAWPDSRALTGAMPPATTMASNQPPLTDRLPTPSATERTLPHGRPFRCTETVPTDVHSAW